jgi:hypothetical protein
LPGFLNAAISRKIAWVALEYKCEFSSWSPSRIVALDFKLSQCPRVISERFLGNCLAD